MNLPLILNSEPPLGKIGFALVEFLPKEMLYAKLLDCPVEKVKVEIG